MDIALITGSCGLIGSEAVHFFCQKGFKVIGVDNDMRSYFFGSDASTAWNQQSLEERSTQYVHKNIDIRDRLELKELFNQYGSDIKLVIHTAAQPSHDWAAREPLTDFTVNANGTINLLELTRLHAPEAVFIFTSTNKVYGDTPNHLPFLEKDERFDLADSHVFYSGIDETMSIDQSKHSLFGASKVAADILVQEYGRYFGMKTVSFRGGCLTGPNHSGAELHGFLSYLMKCCITGEKYTIFGYKGKQVRDNIHSLDLVNAFYEFYQDPKCAEVYNIGGGRDNSCSVLEAIKLCEEVSSKKLNYELSEDNRSGDHVWYITSMQKFQNDYPNWKIGINLRETVEQIHDTFADRS